ncbi:unnamed protein product, partial [Medioppia subpectinata]
MRGLSGVSVGSTAQLSKTFTEEDVKVFARLTVMRGLSGVSVGSTAQLSKTFTEEDVKVFARLTGDYNPIHLDHKFCSETHFSRPIVHGMLTNGLVSAVFGTVLPGPGAVVVNQTINFTKPLYIGEEVCAKITVVNIRKRFIDCKYVCFTTDGKNIMDGTA